MGRNQQATIPLCERTGMLSTNKPWFFWFRRIKDRVLAQRSENRRYCRYWSGSDEAVKAKECRSLPQARTTKQIKRKEHRTGLLSRTEMGREGRKAREKKGTCSNWRPWDFISTAGFAWRQRRGQVPGNGGCQSLHDSINRILPKFDPPPHATQEMDDDHILLNRV